MSHDEFDVDRSLTTDPGDPGLPPVQPPSAGFLVQLFVVPALIVLAVVGVWALFGKIASSDEDWRELVEDIRNTNEHRRWRGANGLATLLVHDQKLGDDGQHLAKNPEIARVLVGLFEEGLNRHSTREDDLKQESFLALDPRPVGFATDRVARPAARDEAGAGPRGSQKQHRLDRRHGRPGGRTSRDDQIAEPGRGSHRGHVRFRLVDSRLGHRTPWAWSRRPLRASD